MIVAQIIRHLVGGGEEVQTLFAAYQARVTEAIRRLTVLPSDPDERYGAFYPAVVAYYDRLKRLPKTFEAVMDNLKSLDPSHHLYVNLLMIESALKDLKVQLDRIADRPLPELEVLFLEAIDKGRVEYQVAALKEAIEVTRNQKKYDTKFKAVDPRRGESGVDVARALVRDRFADDGSSGGLHLLQGGLVENVDDIEASLFRRLDLSKRTRLYTGLKAIDDVQAIGRQEDIRFIGLLGFTNSGKSALLLPILYNMALAGANVLFVPLEFTAEEAWDRLAFMHAHRFPDLPLCSLDAWKNHPEQVTLQDKISLLAILDDLRRGTSMKGRIDVINVRTWPEIVEHLEVSKSRCNYEVLAIDYLANLQVTSRDKREGMNEIIREAQTLTRTWNGGQGMVVITPVQANKEGRKEAAALEGRNWGSYERMTNAVEMHTQLTRDVDALWGVWSEGPYAARGVILVSCAKSRNRFFDPFLVQVDGRTRYARSTALNPMEAQIYPTEGQKPDALARGGRKRRAVEPYSGTSYDAAAEHDGMVLEGK